MADNITPMHSQSCNHLMRVYTSIADVYKAKGDHKSCLEYLIKAHKMAEEGNFLKQQVIFIFFQ